MGQEFFQTKMGSKFYSGDIPRMINALERIADALEIIAEKEEREEEKEGKCIPRSKA